VHDEFFALAAILAIAAVAGLIARKLHQPLIVAFIAVGIGVGPVGIGLVEGASSEVSLLAEVGIAVLLFLVGLKLDLRIIRTSGPVALATGLGQVLFTSIGGFGLALALGLSPVTAVYVAVALTFSSTIIIVKLLGDKRELEQQHGRIAIGFLIVQDIVVILVMIALTSFSNDSGDPVAIQAAMLVVTGGGFLGGIVVATRWILPRVLPYVARTPELLVLFSVAWAVALAALSDWLGFSGEVGAFVAGVALASTPYREAIGARLISLRDFLLLFFFIELGAALAFDDAGSQLARAMVLSVFVLIGNPIIVLIIMGAMGYRRRTSFLAGLTVAQISEFSLILVALGFSLGHIDSSTVGLVTLVGLITIGLSTYLILYSGPIFDRLSPLLKVFERAHPTQADTEDEDDDVEVILYGLGRYGSMVATEMTEQGVSFVAVESDPQLVAARSRLNGDRVLYGDAEDMEFVESLPLDSAHWVVSTIPTLDINLTLLRGLEAVGFTGRVALTAHTADHARVLADAGADAVLQPFTDAADRVLAILGHEPAPSDDSTATFGAVSSSGLPVTDVAPDADQERPDETTSGR
jgi:Kef-type K+ transport system membrane component KefB